MLENKTLANFARHIGISPATARQWKRRGKIVERDSGFELREGTIEQMCTAESVTPPRKCDTVTAALHRDDGVTDSISARHAIDDPLSRMAQLERDSVTLQRQIDELRQALGAANAGLIDANNHILELMADDAALHGRIMALESAPVIDAGAAALIESHGRSNYTGSQSNVGARFDDSAVPYEGDYPQ